MEVHVVLVDWLSHQEILRSLRGEVFIDEQGVPKEIEWDGQDDIAHHFLAINEAGQRVGCGRLLPTGQIGRMAVQQSHRGSGIGRSLLDAAVEQAQELGFTRVFLHAQSQVVEFYRKAGFLPEGAEFMEADIPHQSMFLVLPIPFEASPDIAKPEIRQESPAPESENAALKQYSGESACVEGLTDALSWPHRTLRIYSQELDHVLFDQQQVIDALSSFARRGPPTRLLILLHSSSSIVSRGHRLLELARRLDSKISIRTVPSELAEDNHSCVVTDDKGFFLLPDRHEYQALANQYDPAQASKLADRFDYLWERSETDRELRIIRI